MPGIPGSDGPMGIKVMFSIFHVDAFLLLCGHIEVLPITHFSFCYIKTKNYTALQL